MSLDQITLSVIQASLQQVCDEMDLSFSRAAFSPVIAEANDRSDGIYSACLLYTSPSPRDRTRSRMPSSA